MCRMLLSLKPCNGALKQAVWSKATAISCLSLVCTDFLLYMQLRAYCAGQSQEQKGGQTAALIRQLADWGVAVKKMHEVIRLPLDGLEEQVCLSACLPA